jgi:hypothetical protein
MIEGIVFTLVTEAVLFSIWALYRIKRELKEDSKPSIMFFEDL